MLGEYKRENKTQNTYLKKWPNFFQIDDRWTPNYTSQKLTKQDKYTHTIRHVFEIQKS